MYRLSLIISEIYNKYLPLAEKGSIALNLDFSDTTQTIDDPEAIKIDLEKHLSSALSRSDRGEISISVEQGAIVIADSGTILSKPICALLSKGRVDVTSRVGFGTTIRISLLPPPPDPASTKKNSASSQPSSSSIQNPQLVKPAQLAQKSSASTKNTRQQRKLVAAAKKADRKIQKLRKSQQKQTVKQNRIAKSTQATKRKTASKSKPANKTRKKVIELS